MHREFRGSRSVHKSIRAERESEAAQFQSGQRCTMDRSDTAPERWRMSAAAAASAAAARGLVKMGDGESTMLIYDVGTASSVHRITHP